MIPSEMNAGLMYGAKDVRIETIPTPEISESEVLIKVESCGICATDVKKYTGLSTSKFPIILGHEFSGPIVKVGANVKKFEKGDRVSANPDTPCFHCKYCLQGKFNLCTDLSVIGYGTEEITPIDGAFAQYVKVPEWNLIKLEDSIDYNDATYIEPLACVIRSFMQGQVGINDKVVILGEGRIGLLHAQLAREYGVEELFITGLFDDRLALAKEFGAHHVINVNNTNPVEYISKNTNDGVNVVFDTTGIVTAAEQGVRMLAPHGRFVSFAGFPKGKLMQIDPRDLHYKEIMLTGSFGYGSLMDYYTAGHLLASKRIDVSKLTTQVKSLDELEEGLKGIAKLESIRTIIQPNV